MDENKEYEYINQKVKNLKIFQVIVLIVAICALGISAYTDKTLNAKIQKQEETILELEKIINGDFVDVEELAKEFMETDYVKKNTLNTDITKEEIFNKDKDKYYVLFHMTECPHCHEVESKLQGYVDKKESEIYFYNADEISEKTSVQWSESEDDEPNYNPTVKNFELVGAPTLLKIDDGKASVFVGPDEILTELGL